MSHEKRSETIEEVAERLSRDLAERRKNPREIWGLAPFGFPTLDEKTGGIGRDHLVVLASRPAVGKSALAGQMARTMARWFIKEDIDAWVKIVSLEMNSDEYLKRVALGITGILGKDYNRGYVTDAKAAQFNKVLSSLKSLPIEYSTMQTTFEDFQQFVTEGRPCGVWILDHVGLLQDVVQNTGNNYTTQQSLANKLQRLCHDGYPGICISHMNRASDTNKDGRPTASNLQGADQWFRNADLILSLYRPDLITQLPQDLKGGLEPAYIDILKSKFSEAGSVRCSWDNERVMFTEDREESPLQQQEAAETPQLRVVPNERRVV